MAAGLLGTHPMTELPPRVTIDRGEGVSRGYVSRAGEAAPRPIRRVPHLTSWQPAGQEPVVWMSRGGAFPPGVPIRGGIPICLPWSGPTNRDHRIRSDEEVLHTYLWNPWIDKAKAMADFGDADWIHMMCVEAGNAAHAKCAETRRATTDDDNARCPPVASSMNSCQFGTG